MHYKDYKYLDEKSLMKLQQISINFVKSKLPLGTFISNEKKSMDGVKNVSCGHEKHEFSTGSAFKEIFEFFNGKKY